MEHSRRIMLTILLLTLVGGGCSAELTSVGLDQPERTEGAGDDAPWLVNPDAELLEPDPTPDAGGPAEPMTRPDGGLGSDLAGAGGNQEGSLGQDRNNGGFPLPDVPPLEPLPVPQLALIRIEDQSQDESRAPAHHGSESAIAFDHSGNLHFVDRSGNLIRQNSMGARTLWLPELTRNARGLAFLSTGELLIADSGLGHLLAVYPNGEVRVLVSNLDAPVGVAVDDRDQVYVSEATRGALRRIDPTTGASQLLADGLALTPGPLAFSPDYRTLYVAGLQTGSIYRLSLDAQGSWGPVERLVILPGAVDPDQPVQAGDPCQRDGRPGRYADRGNGSLSCELDGPCTNCLDLTRACLGWSSGDTCRMPDGELGRCGLDEQGDLLCLLDRCVGQPAGTACQDLTGMVPGHCVLAEQGAFCRPDPACTGLNAGDTCLHVELRIEGRCSAGAGGRLLCQPLPPCFERRPLDACNPRPRIPGRCVDQGQGGTLWCEALTRGGALQALATDAAGRVYASDDVSAAIWRVDPASRTMEVVANTPLVHVTGLAWGNPVGGWDSRTLYASVSGGAALLAIELGIGGQLRSLPEPTHHAPTTPASALTRDCLNIPDAPLATEELDRPMATHDVAFDQEGYLIGSDGLTLYRVGRDGSMQLYATGLVNVEGIDWLPQGSLVVASDLGIVNITPNGAQTVLAPDILAYGLVVGPDNRIYAADGSKVWRVDPITGQRTVFLDAQQSPNPWAPRTINFDPDHSLMYIGARGSDVYTLTLDDELNPVGRPRRLTTVKPNVTFLDGLAVDVCGNLYMPNFESFALYRISPDGQVQLYLQWDSDKYGHGGDWGSGLGGWRSDALYLAQPYDLHTVVEVVVGVPGRRW